MMRVVVVVVFVVLFRRPNCVDAMSKACVYFCQVQYDVSYIGAQLQVNYHLLKFDQSTLDIFSSVRCSSLLGNLY